MTESAYKCAVFKLYPSTSQVETLEEWLRTACWVYNQTLEHRLKAYKRRKESTSRFKQTKILTGWRSRIARVRNLPCEFGRDALARVDKAFKNFFRRVKSGVAKKGFPRFKSWRRYNSLSQLDAPKQPYARDGFVSVPGIGHVTARGRFDLQGKNKGIRILRRAHGWYAHILVEVGKPEPLPKTDAECGIDLGLTKFATFDNGDTVENPRLLKKSTASLKCEQRKLSRCQKGSGRRKKQVNRVARLHEKVKRKRRGFAHRLANEVVRKYDRIAVEKLNVVGLANGRLRKSVRDAGWGIFLEILRAKAESAGRELVEVDPRGTSQECPACGAVAKKLLSERTHRCDGCHLVLDRDHAAAQVIRQRAFRPGRRGDASTPVDRPPKNAAPRKRKGLSTL